MILLHTCNIHLLLDHFTNYFVSQLTHHCIMHSLVGYTLCRKCIWFSFSVFSADHKDQYMCSGSVLMSCNTLDEIDQLLSDYFQLARNVLFSQWVLSVNLTYPNLDTAEYVSPNLIELTSLLYFPSQHHHLFCSASITVGFQILIVRFQQFYNKQCVKCNWTMQYYSYKHTWLNKFQVFV